VLDITAVAEHWNETPVSPGWDNRFDRNDDQRIDVVDIMLVISELGNSC
jgi:hypothetical protein